MNAPPLVSVIIPVFNGERYLAAAIESVLSQDYQPLELIVVDDGSTDSTPAIIQRYTFARRLPQPNQGHGVAKNTGLAAARGEFISFLDADDVWRPSKLRLQMDQLLQDPALTFVTCHCRLVREPGTAWPAWVNPLFYDNPQPSHVPSALLARRSAFERVGPFDPAFWHCNDSDWILRARDAGLRSRLMPEVLYNRRVHAGNLSHAAAELTAESFRVLHGSIKRKRASQAGSRPNA
ncbi:MAG: glycosyltransferase family A protein [Anaerolineales bacterium]